MQEIRLGAERPESGRRVHSTVRWLCVVSPAAFCFFQTFIIQLQPINQNKTVVAILTAGFVILSLLLTGILFFKHRNTICLDRPAIVLVTSMMILLGYAAISLLWTSDIKNGLVAFAQIATGMAFGIITAVTVRTRRQLDWLMLGFSLYFFAIIIVGTIEITSHTYFLNHKAYMEYTKNDLGLYMPSAGFLNTNNYGFALVCLAPFALYSCTFGILKSYRWRWTIILYTVLFAVCLLCTESRPGFAVLGVYFISLVAGLFISGKKKSGWLLLIGAAAGGVLLFLLYPAYPIKLFNSIFSPTQRPDSSDNIRAALYSTGWDIWKSHPFGIGAGASPAAVGKQLAAAPVPLHLMYLTLLVEYGIVGLLAGLTAILLPLLHFIKNFFKNRETRPLSLLFLTAGLGFLIMSISPSDANLISLTWMMPGVWLAGLRVVHVDARKKQENLTK